MQRALLLVAMVLLAAFAAGCAAPDGDGDIGGPETPPARPGGNSGTGADDGAGPDGGADGTVDGGTVGGGAGSGSNASVAPLEVRLRLEEVVGGLTEPVGFLQADDGSNRSYIVEQDGLVRVLDAGGELLDEPFLDLRGDVSTGFEQGLLAIAFPPVPDGRVYVSYTDTDGRSVLSRFQVESGEPPRVERESEEVLLTVDQPFPNHNGGLIQFGPEGHLWYGLGDGGSGGDPLRNGQNTETLLGTILRLDVSPPEGYQVPPDNPFVGGPGRDEIYHYGLRNPWRFSFDRETASLYVADVGQNEIEEVNRVRVDDAGLNFGWSLWEGSERFHGGRAGSELVFPVAEYAHSETGGCSVTGGHVYRGGSIPDLVGVYLYGDYCSGTIWGLVQGEDGAWTTATMLETGMNITSFGQDLDGELYAVDHGGAIHRIVAA